MSAIWMEVLPTGRKRVVPASSLMLLAVDIGNTSIHWGEFAEGTLRREGRFDSSAEALVIFLKTLTADTVLAVSSVVPKLNSCFAARPVLWVTPATAKIPLRVDYPEEVGADRLCNAVAAWERFGQATIVVDFGTATTLDIITARGEYGGGAIIPGVETSNENLSQVAAQLPRVEIAKPKHVVGRNTIECIQAGLYYGTIGMLDHLIRLSQKEEGCPMKVVATGGLAPLLALESNRIESIEPHLTLEGIYFIWKRNVY